jgi:hypothetical protein
MQTALLLSVLAPAALAAVAVTLGLRLWSRSAPLDAGLWSLTVAPVLGAFAAQVAVRGFPGLPPTDASDWALWTGAAATLYGLPGLAGRLQPRAAWTLRVALSGLTAFLVLRPLIGRLDGWGVPWVIAGAAALVLGWWALEQADAALEGPAAPAALLVVGASVAAALGLSGSARLAQAAGGATAAFGVLLLAGIARPRLRAAGAVAAPTAVLLGGLVLGGIHYGELGVAPGALLLGAALTVLFGRLGEQPARGLKGAAVQASLAAALGAAAVGLVLAPDAPAAEASGDGYDDAYEY